MANVKINDLPAAPVGATMQFETDIGGTTPNKVTSVQIRDFVLLNQDKAYYVSKNGSNSSSGLNSNLAFADIATSNAAVAARVPSPTNPFIVYLIDGIYTEDFTEQPYTIYYGPGAKLIGEVVLTDTSHIVLKNWDSKPSGGTYMMTKGSGPGLSRVTVSEGITVLSGKGILSTLGFTNIEVDTLTYGGGDFVADGSTFSTVIILSDNVITSGASGTGSLVKVSATTNNLNVQITANLIEDFATATGAMVDIAGTGLGAKVDVRAAKVNGLTRKNFNVGNNGIVTGLVGRYREQVFSTATGSGKITLSITDDVNSLNKTQIINAAGLDINRTGAITEISDDTTMTDDSSNAMITEHAAKIYIDEHDLNVASLFNVVAAVGITPIDQKAKHIVMPIQSSTAGDINITAIPQIAAPAFDGQLLTLIGNNDTKTVTLDDGDGLKTNNGQSFTMGDRDTWQAIGIGAVWAELSRSDN